MGNRDYSYSFPNWKRTHAIDHVPPYDYAPILSKAFFLQQRFPTPHTKKEKENLTPMQNSRENAILGSEKGRRLHGLLTTLWQGPLQQLARQRKKGEWPDREKYKATRPLG